MTNHRGFLLIEVLIALFLFSLLSVQAVKTMAVNKTYVDRKLKEHRAKMIVEDLADTISFEFQMSKGLSEVVTSSGDKLSVIGEEELEVIRLSLIQYEQSSERYTKEFKRLIVVDPSSERKSLWFSKKKSDKLSGENRYEAGAGIEKLTIAKVEDGIYRIAITAGVQGCEKTHVFIAKTGGK